MITMLFYGYPVVIAILLLCSVEVPSFLKILALILFIMDVLDFILDKVLDAYFESKKRHLKEIEKRRKNGYD